MAVTQKVTDDPRAAWVPEGETKAEIGWASSETGAQPSSRRRQTESVRGRGRQRHKMDPDFIDIFQAVRRRHDAPMVACATQSPPQTGSQVAACQRNRLRLARTRSFS
jgi:hypothetical protein